MRPAGPRHLLLAVALLCPLALVRTVAQQATLGYYRFPTIWHDTVVYTAEGDLWRVPVAGGIAQRLTSHPAEESRPAISPDGATLAFSAAYDGPTDVYTLSLAGGPPVRHTYEGEALVVGWTPSGEILYSTDRNSTLPSVQLVRLDPRTGTRTRIPLAEASEGNYDGPGGTLFFTRLPFQGSHTRRYQGGTAQTLWRFDGQSEATPLTADYAGTSKSPMPWKGRVYFATDRDGTMNLWSMDDRGGDLRQHTHHETYDVQSPSLSEGRIVYQYGADLRVFDIERDRDAAIPVTLVSDFDHLRERWIKAPLEWVTAAHLSPDGDRVVLTARGQLFVVPAEQGRIVEATRNTGVRRREGRFFPDGKTLLTLSDESGEVEFWRVPADGIGPAAQLTRGATVLRWNGVASPDGNAIAHYDKDQLLWITDLTTRTQKKVAFCGDGDFDDVRWSPDSKWLVYAAPDRNQMTRLNLYSLERGEITPLTSDRYDSFSPSWSPDGKWLYFLSNRHLTSVVRSPWGSRQPEPFFDRQTKVFQIPLVSGERSPFQPDDELHPKTKSADEKEDKGETPSRSAGKETPSTAKSASAAVPVKIDLAGIESRLVEVPVPPGNYTSLSVDAKRLYFISRDAAPDAKRALNTFPIENKRPEKTVFKEDVRDYELSMDGKKVLVWTEKELYVLDAAAKAPTGPDLAKHLVPLGDWTFSVRPRDEWRQMFIEAWRLERDYFYDRGMHGLDWPAIRDKYLPFVDRITDRAELSDLLAQMVSELSALHVFVFGGDVRKGAEDVAAALPGARVTRDEGAGGFRVEHVYRSDPDLPEELSPLARPDVNVRDGDVIAAVNGQPALSGSDLGALLRNQAGRQVRLEIVPAGGGARRTVIFVPLTPERDRDLRYDEWEYTRRLQVEQASDRRIGYVHLRAMGSENMTEWQREFYPVFDRDGLIIDVRHNEGGNIDSWILEKLLRKAWFYWQPRVGHPFWNMQYAFRGHVVVLCDANTASDGEAFAEGFRRLGLGKVIGTRTWGGEIWLSASNFLVDRGIATSAEIGVFGPEGVWLIEGHGVDPDIVVDNPPHATFGGEDAQLVAAIEFLKKEIASKPVPVPAPPKYPIKRAAPAPERPRPQ